MNNILKYSSHCSGCGECVSLCSTNAISMKINNQGFLYPSVDNNKCIECRSCLSHCTFNKAYTLSNWKQTAYAVKHRNEDIREASRSGGMFTALSDLILTKNGVIYGCILVDNNKAIHVRAETKLQRDEMRGSKYIQSETTTIYNSIRDDLKDGKFVLFSGTSCQVAAVKDYCKDIETEKLILIDIVCHGVPSSKVWGNYLSYINKGHKKILKVDFRNKKDFGWAAHKETIYFDDGTKLSGEIFKELFMKHYIIRNDCFACPYRNLERIGDITLADCWGISENATDFDDDKGVSLVLVNTQKGEKLFDELGEDIVEKFEIDVKQYLQPTLYKNWEKPNDYELFWQYYESHSFRKVVQKYINHTKPLFKRIVHKAKRIVKQLI